MPRPVSTAAARIAAAVVMLDQATKLAANLAVHDRAGPVVPITNAGLATGLHAGSPLRTLVLAIAVGGLMVTILARTLRSEWSRVLVPALMLGGALSNLCDRLVLGRVRDFLAVGHLIVVNFADLAVVTGVVLFSVEVAHQASPGRQPSQAKIGLRGDCAQSP